MKHRRMYGIVGVAAVCLAVAMPAGAGTLKCAPDSVKVGDVCIDTYEASVWKIDPTNTKLVKKVQDGKATLADLSKGGATQLAPASVCGHVVPPEPPIDYGITFPNTGNWTPVLGSNPAVAGGLRRVDPRRSAERLHHVVPSESGVPAVGQAAAHEPGVARGGGRDARPRNGQPGELRRQFA